MDVLKSNLVAESCEKLPPKGLPAAPERRNHEGDHAVLGDGDAHGLGSDLLSRTAIMARPVRLRTRLSTMTQSDHDQDGNGEERGYVVTPEAP